MTDPDLYFGGTFQVRYCQGGWMYCNGNCELCTYTNWAASNKTESNQEESK